ncbi:MAG: glutamate-1-semialdehyde-2,1-aminomutase [Gemmatimonadetes bacterium]|nr:glutamate-1-semialdehyde-2,1-aminomutase [Gemmatimonadota bacterium]MYG84757.1 glutamate-1-semialdehyde-2,1-aminomutase [Gemmatimonadota bacterium]MYJ88766.1 glutamate-1-semialdehyde-2,1-aminomutase [Gemmatimonadota bacterium]
MNRSRSGTLFDQALRSMPGGVNSPVRNFGRVGGRPVFMERGAGATVYDVDGNAYIDYLGSWGPLILGHGHPAVVEALKNACERGTSFGTPTEAEIRLAELVKTAFPSIELLRMVNSGTEATMSALRVARGYTGRDLAVKFEAGYHGHGDSFLIQAGSGAATFGIPDSPGVPADLAKMTINLPYNDINAVRRILSERGDDIACVIVEPVAGNMGMIPPAEGFLETIREETEKRGIILIFDEIITGFRIAFGGAQERFGITADMTCLGKIIGGGLPVGAYGGRREIMETVAPVGAVYQAGTLSGNPLAMTAGYETVRRLQEPGVYERLENLASRLGTGLRAAAAEARVPAYLTRVGSMMCTFFTGQAVTDFDTASTSDADTYGRYFWNMLDRGVYLAPSRLETGFVSLAHTEEDIDLTLEAARESMNLLIA